MNRLPPPTNRSDQSQGFTLMELLVVVAIIGILASMLLPALSSARAAGKKAVCISNQRQLGVAITLYASDHGGQIPFGPKAPPFTSPANFYPSTGSPTSLLSLRDGQPAGLGLLLKDYLAESGPVLFCPGSDQPVDAQVELAKLGTMQSQGSYYYRHGGNTELFDRPDQPFIPEHLLLERLGSNRHGQPIRTLTIDSQFLAPPELATFQVRSRTHHRQRIANFLRSDGSVLSRPNRDDRFTVDVRDYSELRSAFDRILQVLERADEEG